MKRICIALLLTAACILAAAPAPAEVNVNIGIGIPAPVVAIPAGPAVVFIPGTPVYYAPGLNVDIFFYQGWWWTPHRGYWFRSRSYSGPWAGVARPPAVIVNLPPHYKQDVVREKPIPYGQFKKNWREWDRERRWERGPKSQGGHSGPGNHGRGHGKH